MENLQNDLDAYIALEQDTLIESMKKMNRNGQRVLFVTDAEMNFKGVLSEGDVRRWIIKSGGNLDISIEFIYNRQPYYFVEGFDPEEAKSLMLKTGLNALPVIDINRKLCGRFIWSEIFGNEKAKEKISENVSVVIMAGGIGSRMQPFTTILPKPLLPIKEKPVLQVILDDFFESGLSDFHVIVNYKKGMIISYFENTSTPYELDFIDEGELLGTCGGLRKVPREKLSNNFFLTNCDTLIRADHKKIYDFHTKNQNDITMICTVREFTIPYGVVDLNKDGLIKEVIEKPSFNYLVNTGVYVLNKKVIDLIPEKAKFGTPDLIQKVIDEGGRTSIYPLDSGARLDTGQWDEYHKTLHVFEENKE